MKTQQMEGTLKREREALEAQIEAVDSMLEGLRAYKALNVGPVTVTEPSTPTPPSSNSSKRSHEKTIKCEYCGEMKSPQGYPSHKGKHIKAGDTKRNEHSSL